MKKVLIILGTFLILIIITGVYIYYNVKPDIKLNGGDIIISYGDKYIELGVNAFIFNNDISNDINVDNKVSLNKIGDYEITYSITNKYLKNISTIKRNIKIIDHEKPIINLLGKTEQKYYVNDKYKEEGYTAIDNYDGDITDKVTIENKADFTKKGNYEIIYKVTDSSGNECTEIRKIKVEEKPVPKEPIYQNTGTGRGLPILMYHYFYDKSNGEIGENSNYMEVSDFIIK